MRCHCLPIDSSALGGNLAATGHANWFCDQNGMADLQKQCMGMCQMWQKEMQKM